MNDLLRNVAPIPLDWTANEALALVDFLQEVISSVYLVHGDAIDLARDLRQHARFDTDLFDDHYAESPD